MSTGHIDTNSRPEEPITISDGTPIEIQWRDEDWTTHGYEITKDDPPDHEKTVTRLAWNNLPPTQIHNLKLGIPFKYHGDPTQYELNVRTKAAGTKLTISVTVGGRKVSFHEHFTLNSPKSYKGVADVAITSAVARVAAVLTASEKRRQGGWGPLTRRGNTVTIYYA